MEERSKELEERIDAHADALPVRFGLPRLGELLRVIDRSGRWLERSAADDVPGDIEAEVTVAAKRSGKARAHADNGQRMEDLRLEAGAPQRASLRRYKMPESGD